MWRLVYLCLFLNLAVVNATVRAQSSCLKPALSLDSINLSSGAQNDYINISLRIREITTGESPSEGLRNHLFNELLLQSPLFRDYVYERFSSERLHQILPAEKQRLLFSYLKQSWEVFNSPEKLKVRQDAAIDRELDARAVKLTKEKGWKRLARLSHDNFSRIMQEAQLAPLDSYSSEVRKIVENLNLKLERNTQLPMTLGDGVLSSRQIQEIAGVRGKNSLFPFNYDFVKGDDSVFFYVDVTSSTVDGASTKINKEFGEYSKILNSQNLPDRGWVAPYVMYSSDVQQVHEDNPRMLGQSARFVFEEGVGKNGKYYPTESEQRGLNSLAGYFFTSKHFLHLLQLAYAKLIAEKFNDQAEPRAVDLDSVSKEILRPQYGSQISNLLRALGLPEKMEYKVPVFVPKSHFKEDSISP